jgi:ROK family
VGQTEPTGHEKWDDLLRSMSDGGGGSPTMLAKVLTRVALASEPVSRSEISKGSMLIRQKPLASGTVSKAVDALESTEMLTAQETKRGLPGPPSTPLRLSDTWAIIGMHVDQQHEGPDTLAGIVCGLDRKPLGELVSVPVRRTDKDHQHDLRELAADICELTKTLLARLNGSHRFLGVGIEIGGHVHRGVVRDSVHAGWSQPVPLQEMLTELLGRVPQLRGVPIVVENDVNALAMHGYYEGSFKELDATLVTVFRQGVGGALILNGRLYRGFTGMAPEPGHLPVEYPEDQSTWVRPPTPDSVAGRTFGDECLCSTRDRKSFGHVDTLAVPARIEGQLAALKTGQQISLDDAAATPLAVPTGEHAEILMFSQEAMVLRRAGRALGRALVHMIDTLNPGELVLRLWRWRPRRAVAVNTWMRWNARSTAPTPPVPQTRAAGVFA